AVVSTPTATPTPLSPTDQLQALASRALKVRIQAIRPGESVGSIFAKPLTSVESPVKGFNSWPGDSYALTYGDPGRGVVRVEGFAESSPQEVARIEGLTGQVVVK